MACELTKEEPSPMEGLTLWGERCSRPSAIYFPRADMLGNSQLNLVLWFHGFYVTELKEIFHLYKDNNPDKNGDCRLRQSVHDAKQDLVLVAPFLGFVPYKPSETERKAAITPEAKEKVDKHVQAFQAGAKKYKDVEINLGEGNNCYLYLQEILEAIGNYRDKSKAKAPTLGNLYLACHSGGGEGMIDVLCSLGAYTDNLKECWGFDCIYSTSYASAAASHQTINFYLYFGRGSSFTSAYDLYAKKYGTSKQAAATNLNKVYLVPATDPKWPGVEDDSRAFQTVDAIRKKNQTALSYEKFRQELDAQLGDQDQWVKYLRDHQLNLRNHYTVPATLLEPRIRQTLGKSKGP